MKRSVLLSLAAAFALAAGVQQARATVYFNVGFDGDTVGSAPATAAFDPNNLPNTKPTALGAKTGTNGQPDPTTDSGTIVDDGTNYPNLSFGAGNKFAVMHDTSITDQYGLNFSVDDAHLISKNTTIFSFDFRYDKDQPAQYYLVASMLNKNNFGSAGDLRFIPSNGTIGIHTVDLDNAHINVTASNFTIAPDTTYHVEEILTYDGDASINGQAPAHLQFKVNGTLLQDANHNTTFSITAANQIRTFRIFTNEGSISGTYGIDNVKVESVVPEPAALGVLGIGGLLLLRARK